MPETVPEPETVPVHLPEPETEAVPETDRRTGGLPAVLAVTTGVFAIVTTEILPVGLLGPIGATFRISDGTTGLMMTLPGLVAAVAAPAVTVATRRADRRTMLCALLLLLALADLLNALAPAYSAVLLARVALGLVIGAFWSIGSGLAPRLVRAERQARANTVIFTAVPLGSVLGVPAGVLLGSLAGWRAAFAAMAVLTLLALAALLATLPPLPPPATTTGLGVLRGLLTGRGTLAGLAVTFLIVLAHFGAYTYVTPFLTEVTRVGPGTIGALLLGYGAAGLLGNLLGGARAARALRPTFVSAAVLLAAATLLLPVLGTDRPGATALLLVWGAAYGAVPVCSLSWFLAAAPHAPEAAGVLFTSSFQATIGIAALTGGGVVDRTSPGTVLVLAGLTALLAAGTAVLTAPAPATARR
ncbi:MFS transporter [Kitasatospora purpeofusca]|uniref:MFS transporter n=1 Tax=Kitasatospora purpeofusca TaxID=67352 RepID=UPI003F4A90CB